MARSVFANEDLKRHIFSFGYPEHIEFTKSLTEILTIDCKPFIERFNEDRGDRCIRQYLQEEYTPNELVLWINYFARCRCCTRHCHDKPFVCKNQIIYTPEGDVTDRECKCHCRCLARNCARIISHESI